MEEHRRGALDGAPLADASGYDEEHGRGTLDGAPSLTLRATMKELRATMGSASGDEAKYDRVRVFQ